MIYLKLAPNNIISECDEESALLSFEELPTWVDWQKKYDFVNGDFVELLPPPPPAPTFEEVKFLKRLSNQQPTSVVVGSLQLGCTDSDQNKFSNQLALVRLAIDNGQTITEVSFSDSSDVLHTLPVGDYFAMLLQYGMECQTAWITWKQRNAELENCTTIEEIEALTW